MGAGFCFYYIAKLTISRFFISRFECTSHLFTSNQCAIHSKFRLIHSQIMRLKKMMHIFVRRIFPDFEVHMICGCLCYLDDEVVELKIAVSVLRVIKEGLILESKIHSTTIPLKRTAAPIISYSKIYFSVLCCMHLSLYKACYYKN